MAFGSSGWGGTLSSGGGGGGGSIGVTNFYPAPNQPMTPATHVSFDATSAAGLTNVVVTAFYAETGAHEVIYDGSGFAPNFVQSSSKVPITNGFHFDLARRAGWPLSPTIKVIASDANGNAVRV